MGYLTLACLAKSPDAECVSDAILAAVGLVTLAYTLNVVREQVGLDASRWQRMTMGFVCLDSLLLLARASVYRDIRLILAASVVEVWIVSAVCYMFVSVAFEVFSARKGLRRATQAAVVVLATVTTAGAAAAVLDTNIPRLDCDSPVWIVIATVCCAMVVGTGIAGGSVVKFMRSRGLAERFRTRRTRQIATAVAAYAVTAFAELGYDIFLVLPRNGHSESCPGWMPDDRPAVVCALSTVLVVGIFFVPLWSVLYVFQMLHTMATAQTREGRASDDDYGLLRDLTEEGPRPFQVRATDST